MKNKIKAGASIVAASVMTAIPVFAVGVADATVTTGLTTLSDNLTATLGAVAPIAIGIMGIFLAWRYGKRLFKSVAK